MRRLALLGLVLSACGPVAVGAPIPAIRPHEIALIFQVEIGNVTSQAVSFTLDGPTEIALDLDPSTVPAGFTVDIGKPRLKPGEERAVLVAFRPTTLDLVEGTIVIRTPELAGKDVRIDVRGAVEDVCPIETYPDTLDFGAVLTGTARTLPLVVSAINGAAPHVEGESTDPAFTVAPTFFDLDSGDATTFQVTFYPTEPEPHDAYLDLSPCASGESKSVRIRGSGR